MIELRKIDHDNWENVIKLEVSQDQKSFVASNIYSLAECYVDLTEGSPPIPYAIYNGDELVGFAMANYDEVDDDDEDSDHVYHICRLMIDKKHQNKGFGKASMIKMIELFKTFPLGKAVAITTSYEPTNEHARGLYKSLGFVETGDMLDDEIIAALEI